MNVHLTQPTPALTPVYLTSRRGVDTEDGSLASDHDYHIVICSVTRGLVQRPGRLWTPCVTLLTNPAPYTIMFVHSYRHLRPGKKNNQIGWPTVDYHADYKTEEL